MNQQAGRREQTKGKATKLGKAKPHGKNCRAMTQLCMPVPIIGNNLILYCLL